MGVNLKFLEEPKEHSSSDLSCSNCCLDHICDLFEDFIVCENFGNRKTKNCYCQPEERFGNIQDHSGRSFKTDAEYSKYTARTTENNSENSGDHDSN